MLLNTITKSGITAICKEIFLQLLAKEAVVNTDSFLVNDTCFGTILVVCHDPVDVLHPVRVSTHEQADVNDPDVRLNYGSAQIPGFQYVLHLDYDPEENHDFTMLHVIAGVTMIANDYYQLDMGIHGRSYLTDQIADVMHVSNNARRHYTDLMFDNRLHERHIGCKKGLTIGKSSKALYLGAVSVEHMLKRAMDDRFQRLRHMSIDWAAKMAGIRSSLESANPAFRNALDLDGTIITIAIDAINRHDIAGTFKKDSPLAKQYTGVRDEEFIKNAAMDVASMMDVFHWIDRQHHLIMAKVPTGQILIDLMMDRQHAEAKAKTETDMAKIMAAVEDVDGNMEDPITDGSDVDEPDDGKSDDSKSEKPDDKSKRKKK